MFCALLAKISGERLQDHWSSGSSFILVKLLVSRKKIWLSCYMFLPIK